MNPDVSTEADDGWQGPNYREGWKGRHWLVLGESAHGGGLISESGLVQCHIAGEARRWGNTYSRFLQVVRGRAGPVSLEERKELWSHLAFFNYVRESTAPRARMDATPGAWSRSADVFFERVRAMDLLPDVAVLWGYRLRSRLVGERLFLPAAAGIHGRLRMTEQTSIPAFVLHHPSCPMPRKVLERWAEELKEFVGRERSCGP